MIKSEQRGEKTLEKMTFANQNTSNHKVQSHTALDPERSGRQEQNHPEEDRPWLDAHMNRPVLLWGAWGEFLMRPRWKNLLIGVQPRSRHGNGCRQVGDA